MIDPTDLHCDPVSIAGPVRLQRIRDHEHHCEVTYDPAYVAFTAKNHGGIPARQWFRTSAGTILRLGRFLNFGGPYSPPHQESWESPGSDLRSHFAVDSVETIANIADGCGAFLVPFGVLYSGPHHPDEMVLQHSDFVCFNYKMRKIPSIVAWFNDKAVDEYYRCEEAGHDTFEEMDLDRFTEHAADNFTAFLGALKDSPTELELLSS